MHGRRALEWRRGQHLLRKILFFIALRFKFMAKYFLLPCALKMSKVFLVTGLSMPISCSPAKDLLLPHSGPRSSFWLAVSTTCAPTEHSMEWCSHSLTVILSSLSFQSWFVTIHVWQSMLAMCLSWFLTLSPTSTQFDPKPSALLYGSPQSPRLSEQLQLQQRWALCHQQHPQPSSGWQGLIRKWNIS